MDLAATPSRYRFAGFELQRDERRLLNKGAAVALRPLTFDVLLALVDADGRLLTKNDLLHRVWGKVVVEDNALQAHISALRKVLGRDAIATVSGSGYRFTLRVDPDSPVPRSNLPHSLTTFIGREREIADIRGWLASTRLLTLVGAGGCGKTRLALEVARAFTGAFADGVWMVELAPLTDPTTLVRVVARALSIDAERGRDLMQTVLERLEPRRLLLLLDNAEHLLDPCADLVHRLLRHCPSLVILVTSRERLDIDGERTYRVPSMSVPPDSSREVVLACEAARLFIDRARLHHPDFEVVNEDVAALASICRRLDGIALAIELAVSPIRVMSLQALSGRLDDRFDVLTGGSRVALPRHRTLRSLIDWSHDLLSAAEKTVFRRLSVFAGGCTIDIARPVCAGDGIAFDEVPGLIASLSEKHLLQVAVHRNDTRIDMLETVRRYAQERLRDSGEEAVIRDRHVDGFWKLASEAQYGMDDALVLPRLAQLGNEHDNVRAALAWCETHGGLGTKGLALAGALNRFWRYNGAFAEGRGWLARLLAAAPADAPDEIRAQALHAAGALAFAEGDFAAAVGSYREAIAVWRRLGERRRLVLSLGALGEVETFRGDHAASRGHFETALGIARELNDLRAIALILADLARSALETGDHDIARARLNEGLSIGRKAGLDPAASLLGVLGEFRRDHGDLEGARDALREGIEIRREIGHRPGLAEDLLRLAEVFQDLGEVDLARLHSLEALDSFPATRQAHSDWLDSFAALSVMLDGALTAARLWGCAQRHQEAGSKRTRARTERLSRAARQSMKNGSAFDLAWAEGRTWSLERAIALARELCSASTATPPLRSKSRRSASKACG